MSPPAAPEGVPACARLPEAGAYLLGALAPSERADYAAHLQACPHCLREVGQLAGLPGLLARRAPADGPAYGGPAHGGPAHGGPAHGGPAQEPTDPPTGPVAVPPSGSPIAGRPPLAGPPPVPGPQRVAGSAPVPTGGPRPDPVAGALREVYQVRRRRRTLVAAGFVLLAGLAVAGPVAATATRPSTGVTAAAELPVPMQPVGNVPVSAAVALTERPWGTEVVMRCRYAGVPQSPVYVLVARAADGSTSEIARWSGVADQDVVLAAATELPSPRLAELEVRNAAGTVLLRADRPS